VDAVSCQKLRVIPTLSKVRLFNASQLVVQAVEEEYADLLALGRRADKIARHAPCTVLIAH
jgi:nucleotide-binding universal stress UspA family protein